MNQKLSMNHVTRIFFIALLIVTFSCQQPEKIKEQHQTWTAYGGGPDQSKYFVQDEITKENVSQLEVAFTYPTLDERSYQTNPIIVDSIMYVMAKNNSLVALHAGTGEEIWIHTHLNGMTRRGINYWENEDGTDQRIIFTLNSTLQAIDALTGKSILSFGDNGVVDLRQGLGIDPNRIRRIAPTTPGRIYQDLIILGSSPGESYLSSPGHVRAYNIVTGKMEWIFHTIPQPGEYGYDTWPKEAYQYAGGVNCWGEMSVDEDRGIAFIPLGSPTYDYYGADRLGANLFGNCLLALNARTGERIWHFQTVHHDLWDYDLTSAPQLITVNHDGKQLDAVALATKQGFMFAFERASGEPLWPIEERPVPASSMPGEKAWPTQPFPTQLPPFTRQTLTEEDISPIFLSEKEFQEWKDRVAKAKKGLYTPIDTMETISMPGAVGGANWGNTASNPKEGLVYVLSQDYPSFYKLATRSNEPSARIQAFIARGEAISRGVDAFEKHCQSCHGADLMGTNIAPSLRTIGNRLSPEYLRQTVLYGIGRMPAIQHIEEEEIADILALLRERATGGTSPAEDENVIEGPIVASGGAPVDVQLSSGGISIGADDYPSGIDVPEQRYFTGYGLGYAYVVKPPWTSITAYDMNEGTIKWTRPLGEDPYAKAKGHHDTGVPTGSQRQGMVVTSNGLIFTTVTNGTIYAYDAENGEILWKSQTKLGIATLLSMYELNNKIYLVANATTPQVQGWNLNEEEEELEPDRDGEYVVFSLPKN